MFNGEQNQSQMNQQYYQNMQQQQQQIHTRMGIDPTILLKEEIMELSPNGYYSMSVPMYSTSFNSYSQSPLNEEQSVDLLNEKRRKRRESHNAVERRRRDHINEKIQELSSLLPEFASDQQNKPNKGTILKRSVEYIRHMQLFAARQMDRTLELEQCLMRLVQQNQIDESSLGLTMPLGTPIQLPQLQDSTYHDE